MSAVAQTVPGSPHDDPADLARRYGLTKVGGKQSLRSYIRDLWTRRSFMATYAHAGVQSESARASLGQFWLILNPLLSAAVYYLIFGVILNTSRGIENFVAFLIIGVFLFTYMQRCITTGASAITSNLGLVRSFHFPRALLPLSITYRQFVTLLPTIAVLLVIVLVTGEPITTLWLLLPVTILLLTLFSGGLALMSARITTRFPDYTNFLPFVTRAWLYSSGVFFSLTRFGEDLPGWAYAILQYQPGAVYLECARFSLLTDHPIAPYTWYFAVGWALLALVGGFWYFFRGEATYGRA